MYISFQISVKNQTVTVYSHAYTLNLSGLLQWRSGFTTESLSGWGDDSDSIQFLIFRSALPLHIMCLRKDVYRAKRLNTLHYIGVMGSFDSHALEIKLGLFIAPVNSIEAVLFPKKSFRKTQIHTINRANVLIACIFPAERSLNWALMGWFDQLIPLLDRPQLNVFKDRFTALGWVPLDCIDHHSTAS